MKLKTTRSQLWDLLSSMSTNEVIDYFESYGLEFDGFEQLPRGVYRREEGTDLTYFDGHGVWNRIDWSGHGEYSIVWACFGDADWWVRVLDEDFNPISYYGDPVRAKFDVDGNRVE